MQTSEISDPSFVLNFPDPEIFEHFSFQLSDCFYSIMRTSEISDPIFCTNHSEPKLTYVVQHCCLSTDVLFFHVEEPTMGCFDTSRSSFNTAEHEVLTLIKRNINKELS